MNRGGARPDVSVIVPIGRRRADVVQLYSAYKAGLAGMRRPYEFIFVIDGPDLEIVQQLARLIDSGEPILVLELARRFGESAAINVGFEYAIGEIVVTLPGYFQIKPEYIVDLIDALASCDLAIAVRVARAGNTFENVRRGAFHSLLAFVTRQRFRDLGCNARVMKRRVLEEVHVYGDNQRFLALLADRQGFRIREVEVPQSPLDRRSESYGLRDYGRGLLDIFTVFFLVRFTKTPLRFFGSLGLALFAVGSLLLAWVVFGRLVLDEPLADRPALMLSTLLVMLGVQLFALGLLGELVIFSHARDIRDYQVDRVTGDEVRDERPGSDAA